MFNLNENPMVLAYLVSALAEFEKNNKRVSR